MIDNMNMRAKRTEHWDTVAKVLGLKNKSFFGGVERCGFSVEQLSGFLDLGFIALEYKCNNTPTVEVFHEFGKRAEALGASIEYIGFLESEYRKDAKLIIEGIKVTNFHDSANLIMDFSQTFHEADEFTTEPELLRAWYD